MRKRTNRGIATLELLIAFALAVVLLVGATMVSFSGQSAALDAQLTGQGLTRAATHLASTTAKLGTSAAVWNSLQSGQEDESTDPNDNFYDRYRTVTDISPCVKYVGSDTDWVSEKNRGQSVVFQTLISNIVAAQALGGDCDPFPPGPGWDAPSSEPISDPIFSGSLASDVDVIKRSGKRFALVTTLKNPSPSGSNTLWMVDVTDLDADPLPYSSLVTPDSLFAVDAIDNFAFVAGATTTNQKPFHVVDISDETDIEVVAEITLPNTLTASDFTDARSIFYYQNKVYVGTNYMAFGSPTHDELHIFDVTTASAPVWETSINVDRDVNDIMVKDGFAYLAVGPGGDNTVMKIFNIDSASTTYGSLIGEYVAPTAQQGTAIYVLGNYVYLGRERPNGTGTTQSLFAVIDVSNPWNPTIADITDLNIAKGTAVTGIHVKEPLAFLVTSDQNGNNASGNVGDGPFIIYNVFDKSEIDLIEFCAPINWSEKTTGMDMVDDIVFVSNESNDALQVILPTPSCTP